MSVSAGVAALLQGERAMVNGEWRKGARDGEDEGDEGKEGEGEEEGARLWCHHDLGVSECQSSEPLAHRKLV